MKELMEPYFLEKNVQGKQRDAYVDLIVSLMLDQPISRDAAEVAGALNLINLDALYDRIISEAISSGRDEQFVRKNLPPLFMAFGRKPDGTDILLPNKSLYNDPTLRFATAGFDFKSFRNGQASDEEKRAVQAYLSQLNDLVNIGRIQAADELQMVELDKFGNALRNLLQAVRDSDGFQAFPEFVKVMLLYNFQLAAESMKEERATRDEADRKAGWPHSAALYILLREFSGVLDELRAARRTGALVKEEMSPTPGVLGRISEAIAQALGRKPKQAPPPDRIDRFDFKSRAVNIIAKILRNNMDSRGVGFNEKQCDDFALMIYNLIEYDSLVEDFENDLLKVAKKLNDYYRKTPQP